jgi:NADPH:quinone reductase-like Zn-dependent oxidoreductase
MGAGGNLGSLGIQIAKNIIRATVIAAAGSATRVQMGLALGADHGVNYNTCDLAAELNKLTGGKGVDVLYDNIANPKVLPTAFRSLGLDGRLVTAGAHAGPNVSIDFAHLYHNRITIGTAGLSCAGRGEMLRRRRRGKDQATHCSRSAVVTGARSASDDGG